MQRNIHMLYPKVMLINDILGYIHTTLGVVLIPDGMFALWLILCTAPKHKHICTILGLML
jgi:hypothetical protein